VVVFLNPQNTEVFGKNMELVESNEKMSFQTFEPNYWIFWLFAIDLSMGL
jgi:hypothetical protein